MRHGKQTAAFFFAAAMVMGSSPAVVFAEDLQSGAEQEAAATGALAESELTSGEQESTEQTGEAVLLEDNLLSAGSAQEKPEEGLLQDKAESGITDIPIISEWQGETEELWSWVYVEQEQKFTLDEAYVEVFKNHEIKWRWEPVEAKSESAVQLTLGADGGSCIVTGVKGHAGEKGRLVVEVFDENGKQTGSAKSGQIEVREPSYKYDLQTYMSVPAVWEGDVPLRMVCIPEDADHPYGTEEIPLEIVDIKVDKNLLEVQGWENGYVHVESRSPVGRSVTMTLTYKRLDNVLATHLCGVYLFGKEYYGTLRSGGKLGGYSTVKPGKTIEVEALVNCWDYAEDGSEPTVETFEDFYVDWVITEGEDVITIERNKENDRSLYITTNENADGREARAKVHIMHLNEEGEAEEIDLKGESLEIKISIDKRPYREIRKGDDGKLYCYIDGEKNTEFEGVLEDFVNNSRDKYYFKDGTVATEINGLHFVAEGYGEGTSEDKIVCNTFCFFKNGKVDEDFEGLTEYDGAKFYVKDGRVVTNMNGLHLVSGTDDETTTDDKFYFFSNGQIQSEYKGLALYDNEWFYLENGYLDTNTNGIVEHDGGKFIVAVGRIAKEANGLWQDPKDKKWYFAANGQIQTQHTGVAGYDGKLFYVIKGELATDYKGTIKYKGVAYEVINGQLYKKK